MQLYDYFYVTMRESTSLIHHEKNPHVSSALELDRREKSIGEAADPKWLPKAREEGLFARKVKERGKREKKITSAGTAARQVAAAI